MPPPEPFLIFTRKLSELDIPYMVSGSVAAIFYGEPRLTNDVDIIVFLNPEILPALEKAFPLEEFYCPPLSVIQMEFSREQRGHFNLIHHESGFKADIYISGRDPLHAWGLSHARRVDIEGDTVTFAPPEYVIVRKLQFFREGKSEKHLRDVGRMLLGLGNNWDRESLQAIIDEQGLGRELQAALAYSD
jgi:hypothetical protein